MSLFLLKAAAVHSTHGSFLAGISSVYCNYLTLLHYSFVNHRPARISRSVLGSKACHLYTARTSGLTAALLR